MIAQNIDVFSVVKVFFAPFKYIILFGCAFIFIVIYGTNFIWYDFVKNLIYIGFYVVIMLLICKQLWKNRNKLSWVGKIYFKSGILAYLRAFLIIITTITIGTIIYMYVPGFMRWGWSDLVFGNSGNVILQPLIANQEITPQVSEIQGNRLALKWLIVVPIWMILILSVPFWAEIEEKWFRQGVRTWKGMTINSLKFGLMHLTAGIPLCWALSLSVPGFLFACRYRYVYDRHLRKFNDDKQAVAAGVEASTADHAIYNAILITFLAVTMLLG